MFVESVEKRRNGKGEKGFEFYRKAARLVERGRKLCYYQGHGAECPILCTSLRRSKPWFLLLYDRSHSSGADCPFRVPVTTFCCALCPGAELCHDPSRLVSLAVIPQLPKARRFVTRTTTSALTTV